MSKQFDAFINELKQCVAGTRGHVDCTIGRAKKMGIAHANLITAAKALGLKVGIHGNYGWRASRIN